jgi:hypothetical protein
MLGGTNGLRLTGLPFRRTATVYLQLLRAIGVATFTLVVVLTIFLTIADTIRLLQFVIDNAILQALMSNDVPSLSIAPVIIGFGVVALESGVDHPGPARLHAWTLSRDQRVIVNVPHHAADAPAPQRRDQ